MTYYSFNRSAQRAARVRRKRKGIGMILRVRSFPLGVVVLHLLATSVALAQGPITAPIDSRHSPPTDISRWIELEARVLPPAIVPGPRAHDDLTEYYGAANPRLK